MAKETLYDRLADQGMGREVSMAETLEIAKACEEEGLAHCDEKAVTLKPRQPANHPPSVGEYLERKMG